MSTVALVPVHLPGPFISLASDIGRPISVDGPSITASHKLCQTTDFPQPRAILSGSPRMVIH